jgi:non-homologous end joining protein Ku
MHQLKYLDEVRPMDEIGGIDGSQKIDAKELSLGKILVESLTTQSLIQASILTPTRRNLRN